MKPGEAADKKHLSGASYITMQHRRNSVSHADPAPSNSTADMDGGARLPHPTSVSSRKGGILEASTELLPKIVIGQQKLAEQGSHSTAPAQCWLFPASASSTWQLCTRVFCHALSCASQCKHPGCPAIHLKISTPHPAHAQPPHKREQIPRGSSPCRGKPLAPSSTRVPMPKPSHQGP